jgi:hypothetical protein
MYVWRQKAAIFTDRQFFIVFLYYMFSFMVLINSFESVCIMCCKGERAKGTDLHSKTAAAAQVGFKLNSY